MADDLEQQRLVVVREQWQERVLALRSARRGIRRLSRLLARDPGGRLFERARDVERRVILADTAAHMLLALADLNAKNSVPGANPG